MEHASWSHLPDDLLIQITDKLVFIKDYIRFGATCLSWHSVFSKNAHRLPPQLPMLLIPTKNAPEIRSLYSLSDKRVYDDLQVRVPHNLHYIGSSFGWLITVEEESFKVRLINPFSSINNEIHLPPLKPLEITYDGSRFLIPMTNISVSIVLSANPASTPDYVAMVIYCSFSVLGFCKAGDNVWTSVELEWTRLLDATLYKGKFYVVDHWGHIITCDIMTSFPPKIIQCKPSLPRDYQGHRQYLVELCGELVLIMKELWSSTRRNIAVRFKVLKLDSIMCRWVEMKSLCGFALFLGDNSSISLLASDFPGCKPNRIYFTDDANLPVFNFHNVGAFNVEDGVIETLCPNESPKINPPPIWVQPTLQGCK